MIAHLSFENAIRNLIKPVVFAFVRGFRYFRLINDMISFVGDRILFYLFVRGISALNWSAFKCDKKLNFHCLKYR